MALFDPATVPYKHTHFSLIVQISQIQVRASRFRRGGHQEGLEECVKNEKWSRQLETTGVTPTHGRQRNPFNASPYKHRVKKWHLIVFLPSTCAPSLFHILTLHFLLPPSPALTLWLSVSGYHFFFPLPLQPPAFLFSCWLQIMFCNGLRCWQLKVTWFMSQQQLDYDGIFPSRPTSPYIFLFVPPLSHSQRVTSSLLLIHPLSLPCIKGESRHHFLCSSKSH